MDTPQGRTAQGFELQLGTNHLALDPQQAARLWGVSEDLLRSARAV